jgi:hypothetical protein
MEHDGSVQAPASGSMTGPPGGRAQFVDRLLAATGGAFDVAAVYFGIKLGLYESPATSGLATPGDLARRTGTNERMVREWLAGTGRPRCGRCLRAAGVS